MLGHSPGGRRGMKVFISFDMEGGPGIVDGSQCRGPGQPYEERRRLLLGEVNAAIDGALAGGATEIVCNDSHGTLNNVHPELLHGRAVFAASRIHPLDARDAITAAASRAVQRVASASVPLPEISLLARLDV